MEKLPIIPLDEDWHFEPEGLTVTARRTFWLEPADFCVRYFLYADAALQVIGVTVNQYEIEVAPQAGEFALDVTDYVTLEENTIALRVAGQGGAFGGMRLQAVACDDVEN